MTTSVDLKTAHSYQLETKSSIRCLKALVLNFEVHIVLLASSGICLHAPRPESVRRTYFAWQCRMPWRSTSVTVVSIAHLSIDASATVNS